MGWFSNWNKDDDNDDENNRDNQSEEMFRSFMNFSSGGSSTSKVCRIDPDDNNFMICKVKETRNENVNGENVTNTYERDERVPSFINSFQNGNSNVQTSNINSVNHGTFSNSSNQQNFDGQINPFNNLFKDMNQPLHEIFREMETVFNSFHQQGQPNEEFYKPRSGPLFNQRFDPNVKHPNNFGQNSQPQQKRYNDAPQASQYDYSFKKSKNIDRDIADV